MLGCGGAELGWAVTGSRAGEEDAAIALETATCTMHTWMACEVAAGGTPGALGADLLM